ncbi:T9SS type B sorting domain-containing protein [Croceiramulus getboli]|nr:T9SS type B sorting domain-containing protein [Flavobacteriaceae bacterium YJPT1-3]
MKQVMRTLWIMLCLMGIGSQAVAQQVVGEVPFSQRMEQTIKGDLTILANGILGLSSNPNGNYNGTANNNGNNMVYIDIDSDPTTFSSSSSTFDGIDSCARITYAGLYWAATYPIVSAEIPDNDLDSYPAVDPRPDFREIKFGMPGQPYVDITPTSGSYATQVIFNGYPNTPSNPIDQAVKDVPYIAYADVTELVQSLPDPSGEYTVANIRAFNGRRRNGTCGGWTLVLVYETPLDTRKYIASFDGFSQITGSTTRDYQVSGFQTIPNGPVRARFGVGTLEGDVSIRNDELQMKADLIPAVFTRLSNAANPVNNFFNSSVTRDGANVTTRTPRSVNNLGYDTDLFLINNPLNSVIPNGETGATFRALTNGDSYSTFVNTFAIEIIEPDLFVTKRVYDLANNDITGAGVNLGQEVFYELTIQNIGNDNAVNAYIIDDLPINVDFIPGTVTAPPGVTVTFDQVAHQLRFDLDPSIVEVNDAEFKIRFKVKVLEDCNGLRDACSNLIENTATSYYQGEINTDSVNQEPSYYALDGCNFGVTGSTNFLLGLEDCDFIRDEVLCGASLDLTAGDGYTSYTWTDQNGNVVGTTQTITVTQPGTYRCDKVAPAPCVDDVETVNVTLFSAVTSPILPFGDRTVTCPIDGTQMPEIYLCGANDNRLIQTGIQDAESMVWERLDPTSCAATPQQECPNTDGACTWNQVATGPNYDVTLAGEYRVTINYPNGCFRTFFFNVYQNTLDPNLALIEPIQCGNDGIIEVQNVPATGYEFSLSPSGPWQTDPRFTVTTAGNYIAYIRQIDPLGTACVFTADVDVPEVGITINTIVTDVACQGDQGSITVQVTDAIPAYRYTISDGGSFTQTYNTNQSTHTFNGLNPGTYTIDVTAGDGACAISTTETVTLLSDLALTANVQQDITCDSGLIQVSATGGIAPYNFAIYSYNGTDVDPTAYVWQTDETFVIPAGQDGTYSFIVADQNNCTAVSNPVTIEEIQPLPYEVNATGVECNGDDSGSIIFTVLAPQGGYMVRYSIDGGITFQSSRIFNNLVAGTYDTVFRTLRDGVTCDYTQQIIIDEPDPLTADLTLVQDYTCLQRATIQATNVSGGTPPYEYSFNGNTYFPGDTFSGLTDGVYTLFIRDANRCVVETAPLTIDPLNPPTDITFSATAISCPALTSDVTLSVTDGDPAFNYEIIAPAAAVTNNGSNATFSGLPIGSYTFRVTDSRGCTYDENYTINDITYIQADPQSVTNVTCVGDTDGAVTFAISGFTTYDYTITGPASFTSSGAGQSTNTVTETGLAAGTYQITVTDNTTNCTDTASLTVEEPAAPFAIDDIEINPITCASPGFDPGSVTISVSGGWGGYSYILTYPDASTAGPQNNGTFNNLTLDGTYTIEVTDANGCVISQNFVMDPATPPVLALAVNDFCYDAATGLEITASITSGGTAPFQYRIQQGAGPFSAYQTNNVFSGLAAGTYTVEVIDSRNCTATQTITVAPTLTAAAALTKDFDCSASPDAVIDVTVSGGYPIYTYEVSDDGGVTYTTYTPPFTTTTPGDYEFRVTDSQGCVATTQAITVSPAVPPVATHTTTDPSCNGGSDGQVIITVDPNVGQAPYTIDFNGGSPSSQTTYTGLSAGITYNYIVRDAKACETPYSFTLSEPTAITADVFFDPITCGMSGDELGTIRVENVAGGSGTYTYYLLDGGGNLDTTTSSTNPEGPTALDNTTFDDLTFGDYTVRIVDSNGCEYVESNRINTTVDIVDPVVDVTTDCIDQVTLNVNINGGVGPFLISILNYAPHSTSVPPNMLPTSSGTPQERNHQYSGLPFGVEFWIQVVDTDTGCSSVEVIPAQNPPNGPEVTIVDTIDSCFGADTGEMTFEVNGHTGTTIDWDIVDIATGLTIASFTESVTPMVTFTRTVTSLPNGNYYIEVTDGGATPCISGAQFRIAENSEIFLTEVSNVNANCNIGAQVSVRATGGTGPYTYSFVPDGAPAGTFTSSNFAELDPAISLDWDVYVQDAIGCPQGPLDISIEVDPLPVLTVPAFADDQCASDGTSYTFTVTGSSPSTPPITPLSYSLDGVSFVGSGNSHTFTVSAPGVYTVSLRDGNGCIVTDDIEIFPPLDVFAFAEAQPSCTTGGTIEVSGSGGSGTSANYDFVLLDSSLTPVSGFPLTGNQFVNVPDGDYVVRITDTTVGSPNCTADFPITLEQPVLPVLLAPTVTDVSCNGAMDGSIRANLDATTATQPPYTYELFDNMTNISIAGPQASPLFTGLSGGEYRIEVISGRDCQAVQAPITVNEASPLAFTVSATEFACAANNSVNTVTITATITNDTSGNPSGTAPYLYSLDGTNFQTTNTFDIVDTGVTQNFTVYVRDAAGCQETQTITVDPLPVLTATVVNQVTPISCVTDEVVTVEVTGGSGNYTYTLLPSGPTQGPTTSTLATFTLTEPGTYVFQVTDVDTGCYINTAPYTIAPFDTMEVAATRIRGNACYGDANGELSVDVSGYTGAYTYEVFDDLGTSVQIGVGDTSANPLIISNLATNVYTVAIMQTNQPFCAEVTNVVRIEGPPAPLALTAAVTDDLTCDPGMDGTITATASGGWGQYTYSLNGGPFVSSPVFTGLGAGTYTIQVRDRATDFCLESQIVTIDAPLPIAASATGTDVVCYNDTNGTVTATASGGQGPGTYTYVLNYPSGNTSAVQTTPVFTDLPPGTYTVTVNDDLNCGITTNPVIINNPPEVGVTVAITQETTCLNDTEITVNGSNGTPPYLYSMDGVNFSANNTFSGLGAGDYTFYVQDAIGCTSSASNTITVEEIMPLEVQLNLDAAQISCFGMTNGAVDAQATGGLGDYMYTLVSPTNTVISGPQTSGYFNNIPPGTYRIAVDSQDCEVTSQPFTIVEPPLLEVEIDVQHVTCFGEQDGVITITAGGGSPDILYSIDQLQYTTDNVLEDLAGGTYTVFVQDRRGCSQEFEVEVEEAPALEANGSILSTEVCQGEDTNSIEVVITGGRQPYEVSTDNVNFTPIAGDTYVIDNLQGGQAYAVFVRDAFGCDAVVAPMTFDAPIVLAAEAAPEYFCDRDASIMVTGVDPQFADDVLYAMDGGPGQLSNEFTNVAPGMHSIEVQHTLSGCTYTIPPVEVMDVEAVSITAVQEIGLNEYQISVSGGFPPYNYYVNGQQISDNGIFMIDADGTYDIRVTDSLDCEALFSIGLTFIDVEIPNYFTPNDDGSNDRWRPTNLEYFPNAKVLIFDRYSRLIIEFDGSYTGWDGNYQNMPLPTGDYWYVLETNDPDNRVFKGHFTLYR